MTAEVAILNKEAVALAADSAVTIGGINAQKIFPSAQKIFPLSLRYPVGIMIYNHATLVGVPWETIITAYRSATGDRPFSTLRDHAQDFLNFVSSNRNLFSETQQTQYLEWMVSQLFSTIRQEIDSQTGVQGSDPLARSSLQPVIQQTLATWEQRLREAPINPIFGGVDQGMQILERYRPQIDAVTTSIFDGFPLEEARNSLASLLVDLMIRDSEYVLRESTGVVIAGFGQDDMFPCLQHFVFEGVVGDVVRYQVREYVDVDFRRPSSIVPFAQRDGADLFMDGVDPRYRAHLDQQIGQMLDKYLNQLLEDILPPGQRAAARERAAELVPQASQELKASLAAIQQRELSMPILNVVAAVPKDELGDMAEDMIRLTAVRRRISMDPESVGGPIDVAVISKADGFVWMKRKHYFDNALNPFVPRSEIDEMLTLLRGRGVPGR